MIEKEVFKFPIEQDVQLFVLMDYKYPFQPPRIHLITDIFGLGLNDCRDLLPSILGREWMPSTTVQEIITTIPVFLVILPWLME